MSGSLYLAWQYICHHRVTTVTLIGSITLTMFLPAALEVIVNNASEHFRSRAESTPLIVGARGSRLELVLASLYFDEPYREVLRMDQLERIEKQGLGQAIPLHARFQARGRPILGTTPAYAELRGLTIERGRMGSMLGECLIGARVAAQLGVDIGSKIPVSTTTAFTLSDAPLRLHVVGILSANETPDDEAIFVDLDTIWIIEGLGHGHLQGAAHGSPEATEYTDITKQNVDSFHFHGDRDKFPITAILVVPQSPKSETLLLGQYLSPEDTAQIVRPSEVMNALLARVLMVRSYIVAIIAVVSLVTLAALSLVIVLSIRLRRSEIVTISKMGCSRFTIATILGSQILIILAISGAAAMALTLMTDVYGRELVRLLIL